VRGHTISGTGIKKLPPAAFCKNWPRLLEALTF